MAYMGRRDFRAGRAATAVVFAAAILFAVGAVMTYRDGGWTWVSLGLAGATVFGLAAIVETFVIRVQLTDDTLIVVDIRGRRRYAAVDIAAVHDAKGVPTTLVLADGTAVPLPLVGSGMGNSIRAWLKQADKRSPD